MPLEHSTWISSECLKHFGLKIILFIKIEDFCLCGLYLLIFTVLKIENWTSLVAQGLRICLPMQGTWVLALVWEEPTCRGAIKPGHHNY